MYSISMWLAMDDVREVRSLPTVRILFPISFISLRSLSSTVLHLYIEEKRKESDVLTLVVLYVTEYAV